MMDKRDDMAKLFRKKMDESVPQEHDDAATESTEDPSEGPELSASQKSLLAKVEQEISASPEFSEAVKRLCG